MRPEIYSSAGKVWKTCGLAPGQKRVRGQKFDYNPSLKTLCWKIGESFIKLGDRTEKESK